MLAELYYAEADLVSLPDRERLLQNAFTIFNYVDRYGGTYSMDRLQKIQNIRKKLESEGS